MKYEHYVPHSALNERIKFCERFLVKVETCPDFLERILFTYEFSFDLNVYLNKQKDRVWSPS